MRQSGQEEGADDRAEDRAHAAEQDHGDGIERLRDRELRGLDVVRVEAEKHAGECRQDIRDRERQQLVAERVDTQRLRQVLVETNGREVAPDPRAYEHLRQHSHRAKAGQRQQIPCLRALDLDDTDARHPHSGLIEHEKAQCPVRDAVPIQHHEPGELGEGQRHDRKIEFAQPELEADPSHQQR